MNEFPPTLPPKNAGLAVWSLVLGILAIVLSVVCIGPLFAIPAVICGHIGYSQIKRSQGRLRGEGMAIGGLVTGYLGITLIPIMMLAVIAIPNFIRAREQAQRSTCINNLRRIDAAKEAWAVGTNAATNATPSWTDLDPYLGVKMGSYPTCPAGGVYTLGDAQTKPHCSIPNHDPDN